MGLKVHAVFSRTADDSDNIYLDNDYLKDCSERKDNGEKGVRCSVDYSWSSIFKYVVAGQQSLF
jgi:hypothetical protein